MFENRGLFGAPCGVPTLPSRLCALRETRPVFSSVSATGASSHILSRRGMAPSETLLARRSSSSLCDMFSKYPVRSATTTSRCLSLFSRHWTSLTASTALLPCRQAYCSVREVRPEHVLEHEDRRDLRHPVPYVGNAHGLIFPLGFGMSLLTAPGL
jgi:hypothetical protein